MHDDATLTATAWRGLLTTPSRAALLAIVASHAVAAGHRPIACSEDGLRDAVARGGAFLMDCGTAPTTIELTTRLRLTESLSLRNIGGPVRITGTAQAGFDVPRRAVVDMRKLEFSLLRAFTNEGRLNLSNIRFDGGVTAIENLAGGEVSIAHGRFAGAGTTGAVRNQGVLRIRDAEFARNAIGLSNGATGLADLGRVRFRGSDDVGFAVQNHGGTLLLSDTSFSRHRATGQFFSGALYIEGGTVRVRRSMFSDNASGGPGGAITNFHGDLRITQSTFVANHARTGGAIHCEGTAGGRLSIRASAFIRNDADTGGAIASIGGPPIDIANTTLYRNRAAQRGGAIYASGPMAVAYSTFAGNSAGIGGAVVAVEASARIRDSILSGTLTDEACDGVVDTDNLLQSPVGASPCGPGASFGDPRLAPLSRSPGRTPVLALMPGSAAIDRVPSGAPCPSWDQDGRRRPQDGDADGIARCDVGAYEYRPGAGLIW